MSYQPNQKELESVASLLGPERYRYLIVRIADWEEVWSIRDTNGWALISSDPNTHLVPIWPAKDFAAACCLGEWENFEPQSISLDKWIDKWLPGMAKDGRSIAVFPLPNDKGVIVSPERLGKDLAESLDQYE